MYLESFPNVHYQIYGHHINIIKALRQRSITGKKIKLPWLEIVINPELFVMINDESIKILKEKIANLGFFSKISFIFNLSNIETMPSPDQIAALQLLMTKLPEGTKSSESLIMLDFEASKLPPIEDARQAQMFQKNASVQALSFAKCSGFSFGFLQEIASHYNGLKCLNLAGCNLLSLNDAQGLEEL